MPKGTGASPAKWSTSYQHNNTLAIEHENNYIQFYVAHAHTSI